MPASVDQSMQESEIVASSESEITHEVDAEVQHFIDLQEKYTDEALFWMLVTENMNAAGAGLSQEWAS